MIDLFEVVGLCDKRRKIPLIPISLLMLNELLLVILLNLLAIMLVFDFNMVGGRPWMREGFYVTSCLFILV